MAAGDPLLTALLRADSNRRAQLEAEGQSVRPDESPNVGMAKALAERPPNELELRHMPPDQSNAGPTVAEIRPRSSAERGPDGDWLKQLLEENAARLGINPEAAPVQNSQQQQDTPSNLPGPKL